MTHQTEAARRFALCLAIAAAAALAAYPARANAPRTVTRDGLTPAGDAQAPLPPEPLFERPLAVPEEIDTTGVELAAEAISIASIGLRFLPPTGTSVQRGGARGAPETVAIQDQHGRWMLNMSMRESDNATLTAGSVVETLVEATRRGGSRVFGQTTDDPLADGPAFFFTQSRTDEKTVFGSGFAVFRHAPGRFVVFEFHCLEPEFDGALSVFYAVVGTVGFRSTEEIKTERETSLTAGAAAIGRIDLDALMQAHSEPTTRFYRMYTPGKSRETDTELGYQTLTVWAGERGELDPDKHRDRWTETEHDKGLLVKLRVRVLQDKRTVDSEATYFLAEDRAAEQWTLLTALRAKGVEKAIDSWREIGVRDEHKVVVTITHTNLHNPTQKEWPTPDVYLSHVEALLLPEIIASTPTDYAENETVQSYYRYQSGSGKLRLRTDTIRRSPGGAGWTLETRPHPDSEKETLELDSDGSILERDFGSGVIAVSIGQDELMRLWRSKGLPTE